MDKYRDDLTRIKGISKVRQEWFEDTFDVTTYQELADLKVNDIQDAFKAQGKGVSLNAIKSWTAQAKQLSTPKSRTVPEFALPDIVEPAALKVPNRKNGWQPFASFVVEFQENEAGDYLTMVHFIEKDLGSHWPGIETKQLATWLDNQLELPDKIEVPHEAIAEVEVSVEDLRVITAVTPKQVRLQQTEYDKTIDLQEKRPFLGHVDHSHPIDLEFEFEAKDELDNLMILSDVNAQFRIHNLMTTSDRLVKMTPMKETNGKTRQRLILTHLSLEPGMYDLGIFMQINAPLATNYFELPKLNVS